MLYRQSVCFLGKYGRWLNFRHRFLALSVRKGIRWPQTGLSGAPLNRLNASFHD
jgi:hypothetical protein